MLIILHVSIKMNGLQSHCYAQICNRVASQRTALRFALHTAAISMTVTPKAQVLAREDVLRHFTTVLDNLLAVCGVAHVGSWQQLQAFLLSFAARRPGDLALLTAHSSPLPCGWTCLRHHSDSTARIIVAMPVHGHHAEVTEPFVGLRKVLASTACRTF